MGGIWVVAVAMIVLDASVALPLIIQEPGTKQAQAAIFDEERIAPDWMLAEVASGLANKIRFQGVDPEQAQAALTAMPQLLDRIVPSQTLLSDGMRLAAQLDHSLYDCLYLVLAIAEDGRVVTADQKFYKAAARSGYGELVELLRWT